MATGVGDLHVRVVAAGVRAGAIWYAAVGLVLAWASTAQIQLQTHPVAVAIGTGGPIAIVLFGAVLLVARVPPRFRAIRAVIAFLVAELGFVLFLQAVDLDPEGSHSTAEFSLSLVKTAIVIMMVNAGRRWGPPIAAVFAVVCSEVLCVVLGGRLGYPWAFDAPEAVALLLVLAGATGFEIVRGSGTRARTAYVAAQDADVLRQTRGVVRSKAAAIVHDTVLNDLAVLATTEPGPISPQLAERLSQTLHLLASPRWVDDGARVTNPGGPGPVRDAIDRAVRAGLSIDVSGDLGEFEALTPAVEQALAGAVDQCLTNTRRHAGTFEAELTVLGDTASVSVMVVDAGSGFDVEAVDADRLGIRGSVHARIEGVGGSVRIFAKPGHGTSILMTVPKSPQPTPVER
jgi:hypothetical protein